MNLADDWSEIRRVFARAPFASIATLDTEGDPHVTPIGSLVLHREPGSGFWFEVFTRDMPRNLESRDRLCALAVDMRLGMWARALVTGRFPTAPGMRLAGTAGARRRPTDWEVAAFRRRVRLLRWTRGHDLLWKDFEHGREVRFDRVLPLRLGRMWPPRALPHAA